MSNLIVKQKDVKVGDILLTAKGSSLAIIKVLGITKVGSVKYSYSDDQAENHNWDGSYLQTDVSKHTKIGYFQLYGEGKTFWMLERTNG